MNQVTELYRYERNTTSNSYAKVDLTVYEVIKETPAGYWIRWAFRKKFVLKKGPYDKKRYAYASPDDAWDNFLSRTRTCAAILENQLTTARLYLKAERPPIETKRRLFL